MKHRPAISPLVISFFSAALLAMSVATTGCASEVPPEETAESSEAFVFSMTNRIFPDSNGVCDALAVVAAGGATLAVQLTTVSGGCAAGALVTTAGAAEPICLLPVAGAALTGLAALLAGGAASLVCRTARNGYSQVAVEAQARSNPGQICDDSTLANLQYAVKSPDACGAIRSCGIHDSCAVLSDKIAKGASCIDARRRVQKCFDPNSRDLGAQKRYADHETEIENVKGVVQTCRARRETIGCR